MVDPTLRRDKNRADRGAAVLLATDPRISSLGSAPLRFTAQPHGQPRFEVDLEEFSTGRHEGKGAFLDGFSGRANLINDLFHSLPVQYLTNARSGWKGRKHHLRQFWRYLDSCNQVMPVERLADINDSHGVGFKIWLSDNGCHRDALKTVKTILLSAREQLGLPALYWPSTPHKQTHIREGLAPDTIKRLYNALKTEARQIKLMFKEGAALADRGRDPRGEFRVPDSSRWHRRENHAWLVREIAVPIVARKKTFLENGCRGLHAANRPEQDLPGPLYLAPSHTTRASSGFVGKLRWFYPSLADSAVFLHLFLVGTGWNLSTALALDVSEDTWCQPHPIKDDLKVLRSFKARSNTWQYAISMEKPEWHPYQIIKFLIGATEGLRAKLRQDLADIDKKINQPGTADHETRLRTQQILRRRINCPWLFHSLDNVGEVVSLAESLESEINDVLRETIHRHTVADSTDELIKMTTRDAREAWASFAYEKSGYQWLASRLALGHTDTRSLAAYFSRRRWHRHGEKQVRKLQDALIGELDAKHLVDGAALRLLVEKGSITVEQRERLLDHRRRTRVGMACLDPVNPPAELAPDHAAGTLCRIQRCSLCRHGVIFPESLDGLARRAAELQEIQRSMPMTSWLQSDYPDEQQATALALALFPAHQADAAIATWIERFLSKVEMVIDLQASYGV